MQTIPSSFPQCCKRTSTTHLPSRGHLSPPFPPSKGRQTSSRLRRPRRMAQTDIPQMERHEDGGPIPLSFPSREHPPLPFVSAIRLGNIRLRVIRLGGIRLGDVRFRDGEGQDEWHRRISPSWKEMKTEGPSVSAFRRRGIRLCLSSLPSVSCNSTQGNILYRPS